MSIGYHIGVEGAAHSVPYTLVRHQVEVRVTATTVASATPPLPTRGSTAWSTSPIALP